jgi:hypothetical protein
MKINLSDIQSLVVGRGRKPYENAELLADIQAIDANNPDDGIIWEDAQGNPEDDEYVNHKSKFRSRAEAVAEQIGREISTVWLSDGRLVIKLKTKTKK